MRGVGITWYHMVSPGPLSEFTQASWPDLSSPKEYLEQKFDCGPNLMPEDAAGCAHVKLWNHHLNNKSLGFWFYCVLLSIPAFNWQVGLIVKDIFMVRSLTSDPKMWPQSCNKQFFQFWEHVEPVFTQHLRLSPAHFTFLMNKNETADAELLKALEDALQYYEDALLPTVVQSIAIND